MKTFGKSVYPRNNAVVGICNPNRRFADRYIGCIRSVAGVCKIACRKNAVSHRVEKNPDGGALAYVVCGDIIRDSVRVDLDAVRRERQRKAFKGLRRGKFDLYLLI